tara:strand:- start:36387 stop:36632 length:246 start_codon:yes stop_codon:yes gene_type:complete
LSFGKNNEYERYVMKCRSYHRERVKYLVKSKLVWPRIRSLDGKYHSASRVQHPSKKKKEESNNSKLLPGIFDHCEQTPAND